MSRFYRIIAFVLAVAIGSIGAAPRALAAASHRNGVALSGVSHVDGISRATVAAINGVAAPAGGGGPTLVKFEDFEAAAVGTSNLTALAGWADKEGNTGVSDLFGGHHAYPNTAAGYSCAVYSSGADSLNQRVEVTIEAVSASVYLGPAVRVQAGSVSYYAVYINDTHVSIQERIAGTSSVLTNTAFAVSPGDKVALEVSGSGGATLLTVQIDSGSGWGNLDAGISPGTALGVGKGGLVGYEQSGINGVRDWAWYDN